MPSIYLSFQSWQIVKKIKKSLDLLYQMEYVGILVKGGVSPPFLPSLPLSKIMTKGALETEPISAVVVGRDV